MSNTYPLTAINTDENGVITSVVYEITAATDAVPALNGTQVIGADVLVIDTPKPGQFINLLDDGKFTFSTPEFSAPAPTPIPPATLTLADAIMAITASSEGVEGITFASGVFVSLADLTAPVTVNLAAA